MILIHTYSKNNIELVLLVLSSPIGELLDLTLKIFVRVRVRVRVSFGFSGR